MAHEDRLRHDAECSGARESWPQSSDPGIVQRVVRPALISLLLLLAAACGGPLPASRTVSTSQALTGAPEWLEFEAPATRTELFRDVIRQSQVQSGRTGAVLFPMSHEDGELVAAPALESRADLLSGADAGEVLLTFDARERFGDERREAFQGLSEREASELIARSLLAKWNIHPSAPVTVVRAAGAPYAAAWLDGVFRINPAFVYMASAPTP